jgi:ligand-binding sensor domain-containing protein
MGTASRGVVRYVKKDNTSRLYGRLDGLPSHNITALAMDENEVWVAATGGVARLNRVTNEWTPYLTGKEIVAKDLTCLTLTPSSVWAGSKFSGVLRFDRSTQKWEVFTTRNGLGSNSIRSITATETSVIVTWSTPAENGIAEWNPATNQWTSTPIGPDEIAPDDIYAASQARTLWVAAGEALLYRDTNGRWGTVNYPVSIKSSRLHTAVAEQGIVWVGTSAGLARLEVRSIGATGR